MAIPKDITKIDDLFESAYELLTPRDRYPTRLLGNLKNRMKMFTGQDYDTQTVKDAFDRYNFKNRFTYDNDFSANFSGVIDDVPEIGQNFIDDKGRYYIFEKFSKDEAGQNVYQFRNNVGTKEKFTGSGYSYKLSKTDNIYDLKSAQEYGDDMYELYVHKQKFGALNVNDRAKYYEENIRPIQQRIKERQQKINFDNNYYHDYRGKELMEWSEQLTNDKQINRQQAQQQTQQRTIDMNNPGSWTDDDIRKIADGDPEYAQELINQRNAARNQNQQQTNQQQQQQRTINMDDPGSWTDDDIREMAQGDPEHAQELINQRNAARSQQQATQDAPDNPQQTNDAHGQSPEQTVDMHNGNAPNPDQVVNNVEQNIERNTQQTQQTINQRTKSDWRQRIKDEERARRGVNRIDIDEATAQVKVDTSDPYNIYKTTTDAQGNTRTQHWARKNSNSGDATLVSDTTFNADATYNNITGEYSGPDRSHIDWINADEWDDDYILNRAGDNEELMNSMMNARERKIQANEKYRQEHPDMNTPDDINASNNVDTPSPDDPIPETTHNVDTRPQVDPNNPLTWTEDYMDEISEGDPTYYEQLSRQRDAAIKAEKYKNIDPSTPSSWTDDYIKDTALNEDEFNWMNEKMRQAKNLDTVDEINKQRQNQRQPNRQERRQQQRESRQKGNQQEPLTKKERERQRRQKEFEARQRAMGNDPDEVRKNNRRYNEEQRRKKKQQQQQQNPNQQNRNRSGPKLFDENDPTTWTKKDIKDMADGDPERFKDLMKRFKEAKKGNIIGDYNHVPDIEDFDFHDAPIPDMPSSEMPDTEWVDDLVNNADDIAEEAIEGGAKGLGKLGTMDKIMSGVNILGAIGDYKTARRKGHGVISSAVRAGAQFAIYEALGLWALPVTLLQHTPGAIIKGADMLYKENRRMNSAANNQIFGNAEFLDTQQLATMRQSGMEMAKMAQYNLQQTLMGNEATYLHR